MDSGTICHNDVQDKPWGSRCQRDGREHVLGVAVDMTGSRGKLMYGWDGVWDDPMGEAYYVRNNLQLFPAISGYDIEIRVNLGAEPFAFGGPDASYIAVTEV